MLWGGISTDPDEDVGTIFPHHVPHHVPMPSHAPGLSLASYSLSMASGFRRKSGYPIITIIYRSCGQNEWWVQAPIPCAPVLVMGPKAGVHARGDYLGPGCSPCLLVHPVQLIQTLVKDVFDVLHQLLHLWWVTMVLAWHPHHPSPASQPLVGAVGTLARVIGDHGGFVPIGSITYLGFAGRGEVLLDEESSQGHAEVLVGLTQADLTQLKLLLIALHLLGELVDGITEGGGEVLAQHHHDAPQHVVVKDPVTGTASALSMSPGTGHRGGWEHAPGWGHPCSGTPLLRDTGGPWLVGGTGTVWHHVPPSRVMSLVTSSVSGSPGVQAQPGCCGAHNSAFSHKLSQIFCAQSDLPRRRVILGGSSHSLPCQAGKGARGTGGTSPPHLLGVTRMRSDTLCM